MPCHDAPRSTRANLRAAAAAISDFSNRLHFCCFTHKQHCAVLHIHNPPRRPSTLLSSSRPTYLPSYLPQTSALSRIPCRVHTFLHSPTSDPQTPPSSSTSSPPHLNTILICAPPESDLRTGKLLLFRCTIPSTSSSRVRSIPASIHLRRFCILLVLYSRTKK